MEVVSVEHEYEYTTKKGHLVSIKPNENYLLVSRTNEHWWHVRKDPDSKPFYVPAQYMKRSPSDKENSQLTSSLQKQKCPKTTLKEKTGSNTVRNSFGQYRFSTFGLSLPDDEPKEQIPNKDNDHLNLKPKGQQPVKEEVKLRLKTFQSQVETMQDDSFEFPAPPTATLFLDVDGPEPSQESDTKSGLNDAREVGDTRGMEGERQAERAGGPHLRKAKHYSVFSALGSTSVFLSYSFWDKEDFYSFQLFCVALATFSVLGFFFVSRLLRRRFQSEIRPKLDEAQTLKELSVSPPHSQSGKSVTVGQYLRQLSKHKNFMWFVSMNLIQVFHCHFNSNFFPLFLEHLLSDHISASTGSILLGISYVAPHLNNLYFLTLCQSNRVFTEGTCKLLKLVISDLVDEDFVLHRRQQATSALLFGMVALLTKPGQTFAPLIGTWLLWYDIFQRHPVKDPVAEVAPAAGTPPLRIGCFHMLVFVPITCALLQLAAWSRFTLHGRKLQGIKTLRQGALHSHPIDVKAI